VGEVGVHLEDVARVARQRPREAGEIGRAEPVALGAVQHLDLVGVLLGKAIGHRAGAVRRRVVDHEDPEAVGCRLGQGAAGGGDHEVDVLGLVEGRKHEPGASAHEGRVPYGRTARRAHTPRDPS
jgi:hypothetical protein